MKQNGMKLELTWNVDRLNWLWRIDSCEGPNEGVQIYGHKCEPGANRRQEQHCPEGIQDCENPRPQIPHQLTIPPNSNASNTSNKNKYN